MEPSIDYFAQFQAEAERILTPSDEPRSGEQHG